MKLHLPKVLGAALLAALATSVALAEAGTATYGWGGSSPMKGGSAINYTDGTERVESDKTLNVTGDDTAYSYTNAHSNNHLQIISAADKDIKLSGGVSEFLRDSTGSVTANSLWLIGGTYGIGTGNYSKLNSLQALYITDGGQLYGAAGTSNTTEQDRTVACQVFIKDGTNTEALDVVSGGDALIFGGTVTLVGDASLKNRATGAATVKFSDLELSGNTFTVKANTVTITDKDLGSGTLKKTGGSVTLSNGLDVGAGDALVIDLDAGAVKDHISVEEGGSINLVNGLSVANGESFELSGTGITISKTFDAQGSVRLADGTGLNLQLRAFEDLGRTESSSGFGRWSYTFSDNVTLGNNLRISLWGKSLTASGDNSKTYVSDSSIYYFKLGASEPYTIQGTEEYVSQAVAYVIDSGTVKLGANLFAADGTSTDTYVQINSGAKFDINGKFDGWNGIVLNGGTLTNTGENTSYGNRQLAGGMILQAASTIEGNYTFGIVGSNYGAVTVDLGEHTLTKSGGNEFFVRNTTVRGGGTLKITEGAFYFYDSSLGHGGDRSDTNIEMTGGELKGSLTLNRNAQFAIIGTSASITANMALNNKVATVNLANSTDAVTLSGKVSSGTLKLTGSGTLTLGHTAAVNDTMKLHLTRGSTMKIAAGVRVNGIGDDGLRFFGAASGDAAKLVIEHSGTTSGQLVYDSFTYTAKGAEGGVITGREFGASTEENLSLYATAFSSISNLTLDLTSDNDKAIGGENANRGYLDNVTIRNTSHQAGAQNNGYIRVGVAARNLTLENRNTATMSFAGTSAYRSGTMSLINDSGSATATGKITDAGTSLTEDKTVAGDTLGAFTGYKELKAVTGDIEMQNLGSGEISVETLTIEAGRSVIARQEGASSATATLTLAGTAEAPKELSVTGSGENAATLNANLILGNTTISLGKALSINGSLTLGSGNKLILGSGMSLPAVNTEESLTLFTVEGGVTLNGTALNDGDSVQASVVFSGIRGLTNLQGYALSYDASAKTLSLATPEPTTTTLSLLALAGLAARRRRR